MNYEYTQKKNPIIIILAVLLILAVLCGVYFLIDSVIVSGEITSINNIEYSVFTSEKGTQSEPKGIPLAAANVKAELSDKAYHTPIGFSIVSYSDKWSGQKLVDIYNELQSNLHGDEIMFISEVNVYPGASGIDTQGLVVSGTQSSEQQDYPIFFELPSFIPDTLRYTISQKVSVINLYNMDEYDTVSQASETIAHEYGHHYTMYYFLPSDDAALKSEYYNLRGFSGFGHDAIYKDDASYYQNHQWDIYEIAAEDYVQLMGSPNAKQPREYRDVYDILISQDNKYSVTADNTTVNVFPQENINIPLADEVPSLRDYFYSFIGKKNDKQPLAVVDFNLHMDKHSKNGYTYYQISWTKTITDTNALYTLVCYDKDGKIFWPVKTVNGGGEPSAVVGTASIVRGSWLYWKSDNITEEDRLFKLYLMLPDGQMQSSDIFSASF